MFTMELSYSSACFWVCQMQMTLAKSYYSKLKINSLCLFSLGGGGASLISIVDCFQRRKCLLGPRVNRRGWELESPSSFEMPSLVPLGISPREDVRDWEGNSNHWTPITIVSLLSNDGISHPTEVQSGDYSYKVLVIWPDVPMYYLIHKTTQKSLIVEMMIQLNWRSR